MFKLAWQPEKYSPTGNSTSEGVRNQLGRPELDPLTVLVREAAQNSWDARLNGSQVTFGIAGRFLEPSERLMFRDEIFADKPTNMKLDRLWRDPTASVLFIYDRGTTGLTGPTRADLAAESDEKNFVAFLRNIGQPRKATFGGGTYGFGKAVFYSISRIGAICVYTQCRVARGIEKRFMVAGLGPPSGKMTGRHWWGTKTLKDEVVEPLTGESAELMAEKLGFPPMERGESGTAIMVLLPEFGEFEASEEEERQKRSPEDAIAFMGASMLWHFWPKLLLDSTGQLPIRFELSWAGDPIRVPDPARHVAFHGFVNAMRNAKEVIAGNAPAQTPNEQVLNIVCKRPIRPLGVLSLYRYPLLSGSRTAPASALDRAILHLAPSRLGMHHVALMRSPEIVVRYEAGPPSESSQFAGVFLVHRTEEIDKAFADSEPPTHDDWEPSALEGWDKTYVRVALRRVRENVAEFANGAQALVPSGGVTPLGGLSEQLAGLIGGTDGTSPSIPEGPGRRPTVPGKDKHKKTSRAVVEVVGDPELVVVNDQPACRVGFTVSHISGSAFTRVLASGRVAVLDGSVFETDPPPGAPVVKVLFWEDPQGKRIGTGDFLSIPGDRSGSAVFHVTVSIPNQSMVGVFLEAEQETGGATG
jgi:hypothetical protein